MKILMVIVFTMLTVLLLSESIKKHSYLYYFLAFCLDLIFVLTFHIDMPQMVVQTIHILMQKGTIALALFIIVMYLGIFPYGSRIRVRLMPIRSELSITACILVVVHMAFYLSSYLSRINASMLEQVQTNVFVSLIISFVLLVLLLVLGVTSFNFVRKRMNKQTWKSVQKFAYLFFILIYIHLIFMIGPAALKGSSVAIINLSIYSIIFIGYVILRLYRARVEKDTKMSKSVSV